ncbi:MAG TPA: hypothetical protein VN905_07285 [Candidatus Binatia bacterium]|nr:hypothetical protein [Candidatus Binatia bacterium]
MASAAESLAALVGELEQLCAHAERHLLALRWSDLESTLADQRRVIAALTNAAYATAGQRSAQFDEELDRRVTRIYAVRDGQLKRLVAFRDNVRRRLSTISKVKQARRSFGSYAPRPAVGHLDTMR